MYCLLNFNPWFKHTFIIWIFDIWLSNEWYPISFHFSGTAEHNSDNSIAHNSCGRIATEEGSGQSPISSSLPKCPVCQLEFDYVDLTDHIDICLRTYKSNEDENERGLLDNEEDEDDIEVDGIDGLETYTWAGQTRIRSSSLVDGGLRGAGFLTITRGDEDQVWEICF